MQIWTASVPVCSSFSRTISEHLITNPILKIMANVTTWEFIGTALCPRWSGNLSFWNAVMSEGIQKVAGMECEGSWHPWPRTASLVWWPDCWLPAWCSPPPPPLLWWWALWMLNCLLWWNLSGWSWGQTWAPHLPVGLLRPLVNSVSPRLPFLSLVSGYLGFATKPKLKLTGEFLVGFGLLFFGLSELKSAVPDVKSLLKSSDPADQLLVQDIQGVIEYLNSFGFGSVLIFLVIGVFLTILVQSSSAAMGITIIVAINGWINFEIAAAIVLGENIGTTVTAWLASIGANINASVRPGPLHFQYRWGLLDASALLPVHWNAR